MPAPSGVTFALRATCPSASSRIFSAGWLPSASCDQMADLFSYQVLKRTRLPSGVHSGATTLPIELNRVNVLEVTSTVQMSEIVVSPRIEMTLTATRRPSGEKRGAPPPREDGSG